VARSVLPGVADLSGGRAHALSVSKYKKAVLVKGDTRALRGQLKELGGGRWNPSLEGWIFGGKQPGRLLATLQALRYPGGVAPDLCVSDDLRQQLATDRGGSSDDGIKAERPAAGTGALLPTPAAAAATSVSAGSAATVAANPRPANLNKPKRGRSAYILFSSAVREELKQKHPASSMAQLAQLTGAAWRSLGPSKKAVYEELAARDRERYQREKAAAAAAAVDGGSSAQAVSDGSGGVADRRPRKKSETTAVLSRGPQHQSKRRRSAGAGFIRDDDDDFDDGLVEEDDGIDVVNIITGSRRRTQRFSYADEYAEEEAY
jgi:hypothetical protein